MTAAAKRRKVCGAPHPHLVYETGHKVRCVLEAGHLDASQDHFDSFAMRSWSEPEPWEVRAAEAARS